MPYRAKKRGETKAAALKRLARKGPIRARDMSRAGIPRVYLRRLSDTGELERVDRGLYRLADAPVTELHSLAEVCKRAPNAVVCLVSALAVHGLTTEVPHAVWIMIGRSTHEPRITYPPLKVVRASGAAFTTGVEKRQIEGVDVKITEPAKTVADCFRYRRRVGLDVAIEALRDYLRKSRGTPTRRERQAVERGDGYGYGSAAGAGDGYGGGYGDPWYYSVDALVEAARADRIYPFMRPYIEALV